MIIFHKKYDGESLHDLDRDIAEAMMDEYNPKIDKIPKDKYGFHQGTFSVTVQWSPGE